MPRPCPRFLILVTVARVESGCDVVVCAVERTDVVPSRNARVGVTEPTSRRHNAVPVGNVGHMRSAQVVRRDTLQLAPATYNTINKWAAGISDTYALGILAEAPGLGIPTVVLPFVNSALAGRLAFRRSVQELTNEGVRVLLGPGKFEPHAPGTGGERQEHFPWRLALDEGERLHARA